MIQSQSPACAVCERAEAAESAKPAQLTRKHTWYCVSGGSSVAAFAGAPLRLMSPGLLASANLPSGSGGRFAKSIGASLGFLQTASRQTLLRCEELYKLAPESLLGSGKCLAQNKPNHVARVLCKGRGTACTWLLVWLPRPCPPWLQQAQLRACAACSLRANSPQAVNA